MSASEHGNYDKQVQWKSGQVWILADAHPRNWTPSRAVVCLVAFGCPILVAAVLVRMGWDEIAIFALALGPFLLWGLGPDLNRIIADADGITDWRYGLFRRYWAWAQIDDIRTRAKVMHDEEEPYTAYPVEVLVDGAWRELAVSSLSRGRSEWYIRELTRRRPGRGSARFPVSTD